MSPNAIIEDLKQGNAIELGVLKEMKEGLGTVVEATIKECLNRSDGLSELAEKLQLGCTTATSTASAVPPHRKKILKTHIENAIRRCEAAKTFSSSNLQKEKDNVMAQWTADWNAYSEIR